MFTSVIAVAIALQVVSVFGQDQPCNDYVDRILNDLKEDKELFQDPYEIPETSFVAFKKMIFINYTAEAKIYDGNIFGLSTLHRDGDVIVDRKKKVYLKMYLGAGELKMKCSGTVKLMDHGPRVTVEASVSYVNMKLDIVPTSNGTNPKVSNFQIEDVKGIDVKVTGLGPLNFILNSYIKNIRIIFKRLIRGVVEKRLKTFLEKKLKEYVIPEACINDGMNFFY